jgi:hypothetical protein
VKNDNRPYSVAVGTPAKAVKMFDFETRKWRRVSDDGRESEMEEIGLRFSDWCPPDC